VSNWTTVARADGIAEAELIRMRLEAGGVAAVVRDAHMIRMDPILSNIMGGLRIDVPVAQEEVAREILDAGVADVASSASSEPCACPYCGGTEYAYASRNRGLRLVAAVLALVWIPLGVPRGLNKERRCTHCREFVPDEARGPTEPGSSEPEAG
jgi:hypothetical protein